MCWNKEVSITTFILAVIGSIYLYKRNKPNDRWIAVFALTVAMIQLAEFFMWSDLSCGSINKYASIFALLILALEPLMNMFGGIYFSNTPYKNILKYMVLAYFAFVAFFYLTQIYNKQTNWCGTTTCSAPSVTGGFTQNKSCNLEWYFLHNKDGKLGIIWILFLMLPFLTMTPTTQGVIFFALGFTTFFAAHLINNAAIGSMWCWLSIIMLFVKILM